MSNKSSLSSLSMNSIGDMSYEEILDDEDSDNGSDSGLNASERDQYSLPLYDGSEITVFDSYFLVFQFAVRHSLTGTAFSELLQLIKVHLPPSSRAAKSLFILKNYFLKLFPHSQCVSH